MNKPTIYIDGLNVFMRHFSANPTVSLNGKLCGGIVGMMKNIEILCSKFSPSKIIIAWEGGGSLRRRNIDPNYKSGRRPTKNNRTGYYSETKDTVQNRDDQLSVLIEILYKTPVTQIYVTDCEADDIIAYLCKTKSSENEKIIVTSDKDYYQLIDDKTKIWSPNRKILIDANYVLENFNIHPVNFCVARSMSGDVSDGLKGVKGAGFKMLSRKFPELMECKFLSHNDIINIANKEVKNGNKLKLFKEISESSLLIEKNWHLMYLDSAMLSADQIKKINFQIENKEEKLNKLDLLRIMNREGLNMFDIHSFLLMLKSHLKG